MNKSILIRCCHKAVLALVIASVSFSASAQNGGGDVQQQDSVVSQVTIQFGINQGDRIPESEKSKSEQLFNCVEQTPNALIDIKGWADASGSVKYNEMLTVKRAEAIRDFLLGKGVDAERITVKGMGIDKIVLGGKARRAEVVVYIPSELLNQEVAEEVAEEPVEEVVEEPVEEVVEEPVEEVVEEPVEEVAEEEAVEEVAEEVAEEGVAETPAPAAESTDDTSIVKFDHNFSLRTNLLYWLGALPNLGFEWNPKSTILGIVVNGGYVPYGSADGEYNLAGWFVSPEVRFYLGKSKAWFVGAQALTGGYNLKLTETGRQGTVNTAGITGGYKISLSDTFDMDFNLGVGYGQLEYDTYHHDNNVNVLSVAGNKREGIMPIQAGVNLIWKIK